MAVTRPIKYAKHKSNNRVGWTIAIVWIISVGIGSPIVLGLNTSPQRTPELCIFYNSDFIIYSSLGSFYIPCLLMVFLYYRIFKAIHDRAKQSIGSSSSSKPTPSSGTATAAAAGSGVRGTVKPATSVGVKTLGSGTQAIAALSSGPSTIPVKTGSLVKPSGFGGVGKKNTSSCISSADAIVIENISLTARLKNNEESSFLGGEATISSASSSNVEEVIGTGKERIKNDDGKDDDEGEPSNRLSLIRERTTTGSDSHDCQEEEDESDDEGDDEDDEDGDDDDDLPGLCDSDIEAVECKVIKNKRTGRNNRECVINVVQVDVTRTRNLDGNILEGTKLGEEIGSEMKRKGSQQQQGHQVGQATNIRNGNPDSGYVPSGGESESQFCVRNVHVLEEEEEEREDLEEVMVDDIMASDKRELSSFKLERDEGGGKKEEPSGKKKKEGGRSGEGIPSSFPLLPINVVDGSSSGQRGTAYGEEDENSTTMTTMITPSPGTVQLNAKEALVTAAARIHESSSLLPPLPTQTTITGPRPVVSNTTNIDTTTNTISQPSTVLEGGGGGRGGGLTTTIKKKSRFKLVGRSKRKTSSKKKKREKASAKRERKATKTLAIVLGTNSYHPFPITLFAFHLLLILHLLLLSPFLFPIPF